jgi:hypothetical protein
MEVSTAPAGNKRANLQPLDAARIKTRGGVAEWHTSLIQLDGKPIGAGWKLIRTTTIARTSGDRQTVQ